MDGWLEGQAIFQLETVLLELCKEVPMGSDIYYLL